MPKLTFRKLALSGIALAALTTASQAQSIESIIAGDLQGDGSYLWQYKVSSGKKPALSHWVLSICYDTYLDIIPDSVINGNPYEWVNPDPTTGATGVKFDNGYMDNEVKFVSFRTSQDWTAELTTATFKSGRDSITTHTVLGPGCTVNEIPEPATGLLALIALPAAGLIRRRRSA